MASVHNRTIRDFPLLSDLLKALAPVLAQSSVVLTIVAVLLAWTIGSGTALYRASQKLTIAFRSAKATISATDDEMGFARAYEASSRDIGSLPLLGPAWVSFTRTFVIAETKPVIATADPREWFDLADLFRDAGADLRYHAALPGLLVGAGLAFTFLGLAAALTAASGVVAEGVSQSVRNEQLRILLGAASVKFITSLAGLFLSIAYALFRKWRVKRVERAFAAFAAALHARMPFRTPAYLQAEANLLLDQQRAEIQRVSNEFLVNLGATLDRSFDAGLDQHIGPLREAIERLAGGLTTQNNDAMETMLTTFLKKLEGSAGENIKGTAATLDALSTTLDGLQTGINAAADRMTQAAEEMAGGMGRGTETALGGISAQLAAMVETLRIASEAAQRESHAAGNEMAARMADTAAALSAAAAAFQASLEAGAADGVGRLVGPIEALLAQLRTLSQSQEAAGKEAVSTLVATISRAAAAMEQTAARMAEVLGTGAQDVSARLVAATEAMRDELRAVLESLAATVGASGDALVDNLHKGGTNLSEAAARIEGTIDAVATRLAAAGEKVGDALRGGGAAAQASLEQGGGSLATASASLAERLTALGTASNQLANQTQSLERTVRATETPLTLAASDLRAAAEATQNAASPLRDSATGLATAATALAATQRQAEQLTTRLSDAAARFAGLDENLGRTLRSLGEGLDGYQRSVSGFVNNIDQGFSKNIQGLSAIAKGLEDAIEEMVSGGPGTDGRR